MLKNSIWACFRHFIKRHFTILVNFEQFSVIFSLIKASDKRVGGSLILGERGVSPLNSDLLRIMREALCWVYQIGRIFSCTWITHLDGLLHIETPHLKQRCKQPLKTNLHHAPCVLCGCSRTKAFFFNQIVQS
jgi:hypothetical protein